MSRGLALVTRAGRRGLQLAGEDIRIPQNHAGRADVGSRNLGAIGYSIVPYADEVVEHAPSAYFQ